jgi:SAM-dependent methyltransferase
MKMKKGTSKSMENQTRRSFREKWAQNPELALKQTLDRKSSFQKWILERNGFKDADDAAEQLKLYSRILDAGCGNGRVTALLAHLVPKAKVIGVDIIDLDIPRANTEQFTNVEIIAADLTEDLLHLGKFDFIYCQEVLHHTGNPKKSFHNLVNILEDKGKIAVYVYRKKAPAREFMDDFLRKKISALDYEDAMKVCRQIAWLGKQLADVNTEIEVENMPFLGIVRGKYPIQRLIYHFFMKCYWNPELSQEENAVINYDWYHPQNSTRHTIEEVVGWFQDDKLEITWQFEDLYGITVHGARK